MSVVLNSPLPPIARFVCRTSGLLHCVYNDDELQSPENQIVSVIIAERKQERHVDRAQRVVTP
jgi:hypothetical protein